MKHDNNKSVDTYIAVGSNINPEYNIQKAISSLMTYVDVKSTSNFYRTKPIGRPEQNDFLNGVWHIETSLTARKLKFDVLRKIEKELGRIRTKDKYVARTIDLDIVVFGNLVINEPDLYIPDPDITQRPFLAVPLIELEPDLVLPDINLPLKSLEVINESEDMEIDEDLTRILKERVGG